MAVNIFENYVIGSTVHQSKVPITKRGIPMDCSYSDSSYYKCRKSWALYLSTHGDLLQTSELFPEVYVWGIFGDLQ